jgi:S-adenosylmethionine-diacylgycerolhomoserine-N-methlytransferase
MRATDRASMAGSISMTGLMTEAAASSSAQAALMDRIYRHQRHFYDVTRAWYLLGRDPMLRSLAVPRGGTVLEVGCGTGRNLAALRRLNPDSRLFGIDLSRAMLESAHAKLSRDNHGASVRLAQGDATAFDGEALFGVPAFDRVIFSYTLSMVPEWQAALSCALTHVAPGGSLHLVDFGDCNRLPGVFHSGLKAWLARFHVTPRAALLEPMPPVQLPAGMAWRSARSFRGYAVTAVISA